MILTLEFLGPYAAADVSRKDTPEWPPHPDRVYQSMVDAAALEDVAELDALRWLEAQPAPSLVVPDAVQMANAETFVPVNYPDSGDDLEARTKQPRPFPMVWPRGPVKLRGQDPEPATLAVLQRIGHRISHVGRAESQVLASFASGAETPSHVPDPRGSVSLRVPAAGRVDDLEAAFQGGRYPPPSPTLPYLRHDRVEVDGPWAELLTVKLRHPLSVTRVADVTGAFRRAMLSLLGDGAPVAVHGHYVADRRGTNHVAWLGLPNLSPFARGELLGLGMAMPAGMLPSDRARTLQALLALDHIIVQGRRVAVEPPTIATSLASKQWCGPARRWCSVTPVVLDRYPKAGKLTVESILRQGLVDVGFPEPKSIRLVDTGALGPSLPSVAFRLRRPGRLYGHVAIEFHSPVHGPVIVGAERHFGLGLCLPA